MLTSTPPSQYRTGDLVSARPIALPFLVHKGIVVIDPSDNQPCIWHCTPNNHNDQGGSILNHSVTHWLSTRTLTLTANPIHHNLTKEQIEARIQPILSKHFNYLSYNCEHFTSEVLYNKPYSPQVTLWSAILILSSIYLLTPKHKNKS